MAILSCDEDTGTLGDSLTDEGNKLVVTTQNFNILTSSMPVESVYSRERQCYVGKVLDPETGTYVKSEFTTQFNMMEHAAEDMPKKDDLLLNENGEIVADSSFIMIYFDVPSSYGDTLATMKLRMSELSKPITGADTRYTNFDVKSSGYLRENGFKKDLMFSIRDLTRTDSVRYLIDTNLHRTSTTSDNGWYDNLRIWLTDPYTDKNGKTYPDYATYILRTFYDHPEYFKKCPKSVVQSDWYYDECLGGFDLAKDKTAHRKRLKEFWDLEAAGFDQIPCGTNWIGHERRRAKIGANDVIGKLVKLGREVVSDKHLLGFMMAPWASCNNEQSTQFNLEGVDLFADALEGKIADVGPFVER
jgi:hypothetical protein